MRRPLDHRQGQPVEECLAGVETIPVDLQEQLVAPGGPGDHGQVAAEVMHREPAYTFFADGQPPPSRAFPLALLVVLVVHGRAQPFRHEIIERHAQAVVGKHDRRTFTVGEVFQLHNRFGRICVVGVLHQFDKADRLVTDQMLAQDADKAGTRPERNSMRTLGHTLPSPDAVVAEA